VNAECSNATTATVDGGGMVGAFSSLTIGTDGLGLISYLDGTFGFLKVAHCTSVACTSASTATIDDAFVVGFWTSITIGADGLGVVSQRR
jgi:hypothetical protein